MIEFVPRMQAVDLVKASVPVEDRVLITGASGWFGRSAIALLTHAHSADWVRENCLLAASSQRVIDVLGSGCFEVRRADTSTVEAFAPRLILNCAFPTRDRVEDLGFDAYVSLARRLSEELLDWSCLESVERVVTMSSGASVPSEKFPADLAENPYGTLKSAEAVALLDLASTRDLNAQVCRVWAVSGPHVQHPRSYALSDFILQARLQQRIVVRAAVPVIRAYASVDDILAIALAEVVRTSGLFDVGGEVVEVGDLAEAVAEEFTGVGVSRPEFDALAPADRYCSSGVDWEEACLRWGYEAAGLKEQILSTVPAAGRWPP